MTALCVAIRLKYLCLSRRYSISHSPSLPLPVTQVQPLVVVMTLRVPSSRPVDGSLAYAHASATFLFVFFTLTICHGADMITSLWDKHDVVSVCCVLSWAASDVIAALVVVFAKATWKKRAAPEPSPTTSGGSTASTTVPPASPKKMPRASTAPVSPSTSASASAAPRPREGPAILSIRPYGLEAIALWRLAPEGSALWQIQVTHDVAKPITKNLWQHFNAYLATLHAENPEAPSNLRELEANQAIRLVLTRPDPENAWIGYKDWRVAFYVAAPDATEIENFLALWDGFLVYRRRVGRIEGMTDFSMQVHLQRGINVDPTAFDYPDYAFFRDCTPSALPHAVTDAWPPSAPAAKGMLKLVVQFESESEVTFILTGPTWSFRERIRGLGGHDWELTEDNTTEARVFARVWPKVSTDDPALALSFFGSAVLQEAPVLVSVEDVVAPGTPNEQLIDAIRNLASVARVDLV